MGHRIFRAMHSRTVRISDAPTFLPNSSRIGFGKYRAEPGDLVRFEVSEGDHRWGRVVGRITSHFDRLEDCRGFLVVIMVGSTQAFGSVFWVEPSSVSLCEPIEQSRAFLSRFLSADAARLEAYAKSYDSRDLGEP